MKHFRFLLFTAVALFSFLSSNGQERYTIKKGDPNGINKWYMGRQIAYVMSHWGIDWLERPERQFEENSTLLLKNLNLKSGMQIADIGAGSGYYSSLISKRIGNGKVYAVDVEPQMILFLNERIKEEKLSNVTTVLGSETSVALPSSSMDLILLVDVYHEFSFPYEMGLSMYNALKPNGRLVLVEFRSEDESVPIKTIHKMSEAQSVKELKAVGFRLEKNISNLPWQHCMVFVKEKSTSEKN
ncbi:MAG: class I SAM-dependent methyltransferase [Chitinophagaceae bacterium]|jgi:ubiquinone/menaquinone biosynthesis C-methylase UbiE